MQRHELLAHTADAGLTAVGPTLAGVLEEAAAALAELAADTQGAESAVVPTGRIAARDLPALAFAWLNELLGLAESRDAALVRATVLRAVETDDGWEVEGRAYVAPYGGEVRARRQVKAVTFHRLSVEEGPDGWTLTAYVDL